MSDELPPTDLRRVTNGASVADAAELYTLRGWRPVPLGGMDGKDPSVNGTGWQHKICKPANFRGWNVGILLGPVSENLADVDIDCDEARAIAELFLPPTPARFGRASAPESHWLYVVDDPPDQKPYKDIAVIQPDGKPTFETIVELRCSAGEKPFQTMAPPSLHKESGEKVEWVKDVGDPAHVTTADLQQAVRRLAACALLARHFPAMGGRHDFALALGGALLRHGWAEEAAADFVWAACAAGGSTDPDKHRKTVESTVKRLSNGGPATGIPRLKEIVGDKVVEKLVLWLGLDKPTEASSDDNPGLPPTVEAIMRSPAYASPVRHVATPWPDLDARIGGGLPSRALTLLPAPTGSGKSGWALCMARHAAAAGTPVLALSTELDEQEVAARLAAQVLDRPIADLLAHRVSPGEAAAALAGLPVYVWHPDTIAGDWAKQLEARAKLVAAAHGGRPPLVVVDYVQMLAVDDEDRRRLSVSAVANSLRRLARDLDTAVLGVSSVSRAYYGTARKALADESDPRAWLAAAKESGDCEYAAAVVIYLDVASETQSDGSQLARAIVAKARRGQVGFAGLRFHGAVGRFTPAAEAIEAMAPGVREGRRDGEDDMALGSALRTGARTVRELRTMLRGRGNDRIARAIERGVLAGKIEHGEEDRPNARGQVRTVPVLHLVRRVETPTTDQPPRPEGSP